MSLKHNFVDGLLQLVQQLAEHHQRLAYYLEVFLLANKYDISPVITDL